VNARRTLAGIGLRSLLRFAAIAVLWAIAAWMLVDRQREERTAQIVARESGDMAKSVDAISANVDRLFNRLHGVAAILANSSDVKTGLARFGPDAPPSGLSYEERKAAWTAAAELRPLDDYLRIARSDIGVDIIWVLNAGGDCVAASNAGESLSFVGTNYGDRDYFRAAKAGERGRQYAVGRVTKVPGLFFSAPVSAQGRVLGAVALKSDLTRLASALNDPHAFVTDDRGVIILSADPEIDMRALPDATVGELGEAQRKARYMRTDFAIHDVRAARDAPGLFRVGGSPYLHAGAKRELAQHGITVHILRPLGEIATLQRDALVAFLLVSLAGILLAGLAFVTAAYAARAREHRLSMEARNAALKVLNEHLASIATVDALTGLHNRRFLDDALAREVARAHRKSAPLALIMIDIDHFKRFNDTFGHKAGDHVMRRIGELLRNGVRASDVACRYGGEEFAVVMPDASLEAARDRAEALRVAARELESACEGVHLGPITISLGVAALSPGGSASALIAAADAALFEAKRGGRDRVVVAREPESTVQRMTEARRSRVDAGAAGKEYRAAG
jgi:diguanylate cyclase (GGDEF)-like protein